jgi:hypothetical protein
MKRTRSHAVREDDSMNLVDEGAQRLQTAAAGGTTAAIAALPVADPGQLMSYVFPQEIESFASSIASRVPPALAAPRYVPTVFNNVPAPDPLDISRKVLYEGIRMTNTAPGWVARWPGPSSSVDILARFSSDLCTFFFVDVNTTVVIPDLTRRTVFLTAIHALRAFFEAHRADMDEFAVADRVLNKARRNRIIEMGDNRLVSIRTGAIEPFPENWEREVHAYFAHLEAVCLRWHATMAKVGKLLQELVALLEKIRTLLLAEVPPIVRELLWPGE